MEDFFRSVQFWSEICCFYAVLIVNFEAMKYLRLIPALLLAALMASCSTTKKFEKLYYAKEYDKVIQSLAPDICKGDKDPGRINLVAASYHNANQADHERIQALKATGQPDVWPEIYQRYCSMKGRSEALACFPSLVKMKIHYVPLNLDDDMMVARNKAESFLVAKIDQLLSTGTKEDGQNAMKYYVQLWKINTTHPNNQRYSMRTSLCYGDAVMLSYGNSSDYDLSPEFKSMVLGFDEGELPTYNEFHTERDRRLFYMYTVAAVVKEVKVSPVKLDEVTFKETNGGKTVQVTDHTQNKNVTVKGNIVCFCSSCSIHPDEPMFSVPFEVTSTFKNDYTTIKGDREACSAETLSRLNTQPVPVPTDESMLLDAAKKLNDLIAAELKK